MNKTEFTEQLKQSLNGLSELDIKKSVDYYEEMIEDRIEDGMTEEEAVSAMGSIDEIKSKILEETPIAKIVKEKMKPKRALRAWEIALLIIGAPLWIPISLVMIICCLWIFLCFWIIILCLYATDFAIFASGFGFIIGAFIQNNGFNTGLFLAGGGIALVGAAILLFFGFTQIAKGMFWVSKRIVLGIKKLFVGGKQK